MLKKSTDYVGSLAKGLRVVEAFSANTPKLSVSEAAEIAELDRATARRCLLTLNALGYLDYDGKYFSPTMRILRLGMSSLSALPLPQLIQPWIDQLSEQIGQAVSVSILDNNDIVYIARAAQRRVMSIGLMPGSRLPAHCTSMGRVLLSSKSPAEIDTSLSLSDLTPNTRHSLTDPKDIKLAVFRSAEKGYALVDQEVELGLRSLAVPVLNNKGMTVAAMNIAVAAFHNKAEDLVAEYLPNLLRVQNGLRDVFI